MTGLKALVAILFIGIISLDCLGQSDTFSITIGDKNVGPQFNKSADIVGTITSKDNEPIIGALIQINGANNTVTDEDGKFKLRLALGKYLVSFSSLGFNTKHYSLQVYSNGLLDVKLDDQTIALTTVEVSANANNRVRNNIGLEIMDLAKLEKQTKFLGELDVLRSLQSISGVSSIGEGSSGINVRGGNADENLILQDQHLILNPTHALGIFSLTHPDLVESISLHKGDLPARYGGRLSSVLDIKLKEGNLNKYAGNIGVGIATSKISLEGPIVKNKVSFIFGVRGSYLDWLLKRSKNVNLSRSHAFFYDGTGKIDARLTNSTKAGISYFSSGDDFQFSDEVKFDYQTNSIGGYLNQIIGKTTNLTLNINKGKYNSNLFDIKSNDQSKFNTRIDYTRLKLSVQNQLSKDYFTEIGTEYNIYQVLPGQISPYSNNSNIKTEVLPLENGAENGFYTDHILNLNSKFQINAGLRVSIFSNKGQGKVFTYTANKPKYSENINDTLFFDKGALIKKYVGWEPRISFSYSISSSKAIKGGYSRSYQYLNLLSNTSSASPTDLWQLSNYHIGPQSANSFSMGYFHKPEIKKYEYYINAFYKIIDQSIDYRDFAIVLLNKQLESDILRGDGKAYGMELFYALKSKKNTLEANYTYTRSLKKMTPGNTQVGINKGAWYPSNFDKPHTINLTYTWNISKKSSFNSFFTYSSGRPTTAPIGVFNQENISDIPLYSSRNQFRIPSYHRMDIAYNIGPWGKGTTKHTIVLSVYNVYSHNNAYSVFFRQNAFLKTQTYRISVIGAAFPSINYQVKF